MMNQKIIQFIKNWTLPISMSLGVLSYFIYTSIPLTQATKGFVNEFISILQPLLIFAMLFIAFCKVDPLKLRLCKWHIILLSMQILGFCLLSLFPYLFPSTPYRVVFEGAMLCIICPTATAAAVVTQKLGGNATSLTTYTILINFAVALIVPLIIPMINPNPEMTFGNSFALIIGKVFPLLFGPFLLAAAVRYTLPKFHSKIIQTKDLAFYLWAVSLAIAIAVTTKSIMHSTLNIGFEIAIAVVSLVCCALQFILGRKIGVKFEDTISATQAFGQKNTVFAIWMGYTFLTPITSIAGGFYSVWHNVFNSYQLYQKREQNS